MPRMTIATAITAIRKEDGKQQDINNPMPNETKTIPKPQFLCLLISSPLNFTVIFIIFINVINVKKPDLQTVSRADVNYNSHSFMSFTSLYIAT